MNESQNRLLDDIIKCLSLKREEYSKILQDINKLKSKKPNGYKDKISKLKVERENIISEITLLKSKKSLLEELISYENKLKEETIILLIEKLLDVKISSTLGYVVDYNRYGGIPKVLYKDIDTLNHELNKMYMDIDSLYENGKIGLDAQQNMKRVLKKVYAGYRKNAPKIEDKIDIRDSHEFKDFVKVSRQKTVPQKRKKKIAYQEFVLLQKDDVRINKDLETKKRLKELEIRRKELGLSKNNFDSVVKKEMKLHKVA